MERIDEKIVLIFARNSDEFESRVNTLLSEGNWRVAHTQISTWDSDYHATLIKSLPAPKTGALADAV